MDEGLCKVYCINCYDVLSMLEKDLVVPGSTPVLPRVWVDIRNKQMLSLSFSSVINNPYIILVYFRYADTPEQSQSNLTRKCR